MLNFMATQLHLYKQKLTEALTKLTNDTQSLIHVYKANGAGKY